MCSWSGSYYIRSTCFIAALIDGNYEMPPWLYFVLCICCARLCGCSPAFCWTSFISCTDVVAINGDDTDALRCFFLTVMMLINGGDDLFGQVCVSLPSRWWSHVPVHGGRRQPKKDTLRLSARNQEPISGYVRGQVRIFRLFVLPARSIFLFYFHTCCCTISFYSVPYHIPCTTCILFERAKGSLTLYGIAP